MADVTSIYGNPIKDAVARQDITEIQADLTAMETQLEQTTAEALSAYVTDTASGAIASFTDGADGVPVKSLTVDIEPVQSGSGDPSPTNVRPISGHTQAVVTVSPTTDAQDGTSYTIGLNGTRYGGSLDVTTGVLTVDRAIYVLTGSETWTAWGSHAYFANVLPSRSVDKDNTINCILSMAAGNTVAAIYTGGAGVGTRSTRLYISTDVHTNIGAYTGMQVVYKLDTPFEVAITPQNDISTVLGQNNIWASTGDTEVTYRADTKLYIEKIFGST